MQWGGGPETNGGKPWPLWNCEGESLCDCDRVNDIGVGVCACEDSETKFNSPGNYSAQLADYVSVYVRHTSRFDQAPVGSAGFWWRCRIFLRATRDNGLLATVQVPIFARISSSRVLRMRMRVL